jgi:hypothetical protein
MSLCTWATVVSTVPSQSVGSVETSSSEQFFGNVPDNGDAEPVPLPTFLSFLELLEELNRFENDSNVENLFCRETFYSSSSFNSTLSDVDLETDFDLDSLLNDDILDSEPATSGVEIFSCSTPEWISEPALCYLNSGFCAADCSYDFAVEFPDVKQDFDASKIFVEKGFCDWSPELFDEVEHNNPPLHETSDAEARDCESKQICIAASGKRKACSRKEPVQENRKRKCTNDFSASDISFESLGTTNKPVKY